MTAVLQASEIAEGQSKCVDVGGKRVAVFNVGGKFYAMDDTCTHAGGPLSDGNMDGTTVSCPWHGAEFDVTSGKVLNGPAAKDVRSYKVKVAGNDLTIEASY